ncbi:MAG TPA: GNAT family N-acetyltransferase [Parachlamydiaceae bacterium]|nr:GNAT family N-acetyltransferase [Parachlamydiaceae bacterium]
MNSLEFRGFNGYSAIQPTDFQTKTELDLKLGGIKTERLNLRVWNDLDVNDIHSIMQDPDVNYFLQRHNLDKLPQIELIANKANENISKDGYGYFICEHRETKEVIGMVGLNYVDIPEDSFPCYTISWILKKSSWGKGYATEAARALMIHGFEILHLPKIFACTTWNNTDSEKVMKRLGMEFVKEFEFPGFEKNDLFCKHVLYVKEK